MFAATTDGPAQWAQTRTTLNDVSCLRILEQVVLQTLEIFVRSDQYRANTVLSYNRSISAGWHSPVPTDINAAEPAATP